MEAAANGDAIKPSGCGCKLTFKLAEALVALSVASATFSLLRLLLSSHFLLENLQKPSKMVRKIVYCRRVAFLSPHCSASAYPSMLDKPACKSAMHAGNCTVWSTASSLTDRCLPTRPSVGETTPSTRFSAKLELGNTYPVPCLSTWSLPLWVSGQQKGRFRAENYRSSAPHLLLCLYVHR